MNPGGSPLYFRKEDVLVVGGTPFRERAEAAGLSSRAPITEKAKAQVRWFRAAIYRDIDKGALKIDPRWRPRHPMVWLEDAAVYLKLVSGAELAAFDDFSIQDDKPEGIASLVRATSSLP